MTEDLENLAFELKRRGIKPGYFAEQKRRGKSSEQILAAWPIRSLSSRVGSRRFRRRLVVATYGGFLLIAAIVKLVSLTSPAWFPPFIAVMLSTSIIQAFWLFRLGRTYVNAPRIADAELDERLVQIKNQAFRTAYQVLVPVSLAAWGLSSVALTTQPANEGYLDSLLLLWGVALLAGTLPTAIVAWREPDPQT